MNAYPASELARARDFLAELVAVDPIYLPVFARLDKECHLVGVAPVNPVEQARQMVRRAAG